jgi:hypothetical protein
MEIQIRAYRKDLKPDQKVMEYWGNLEEIKLLFTIYPEMNLEKFDIMQFTGLRDKNGKGKEVYQSDLIRVCPGGYEPREIYEVVWDEERLCWGIKSKIGLITSLWTFEKDFEVIGNSYENKELLK